MLTQPDSRNASVLDFCNEVRALINLPPLAAMRRGVLGNAWQCPVGRTITAGAPSRIETEFTGETLRVWCATNAITHQCVVPEDVRLWSIEFDRGDHPRFAMERWW